MGIFREKIDVAISFAEAQDGIAKRISEALAKRKLNTYYYKDLRGNDRKTIEEDIWDNYFKYNRTTLVIVSEDYHRNPWTRYEKEVINEAYAKGKKDVFLLTVNNAPCTGLPGYLQLHWEENPHDIARRINERIRPNWLKRQLTQYSTTVALIVLIALSLLTIYLLRTRPQALLPESYQYHWKIHAAPTSIQSFVLTDGFKGDRLKLTVNGQIMIGQYVGNTDANGKVSGILGFNMSPFSHLPEFSHAALLYRFPGYSDWEVTGLQKTILVPADSPLKIEFLINDRKDTDNSGAFDVETEVFESAD